MGRVRQMTVGFGAADRRDALTRELVGWERYQVQVGKYHVMFWFENGWCLLNVAWRFAFVSADRLTAYTYDVQAEGGRKAFDIDRILCTRIVALEFPDDWELHLIFANGDKVIIFDQPHMRSCWFYRYASVQGAIPRAPVVWAIDDAEPEDVGRFGYVHNRMPARP
jgi:hypothetical protein